MESEWAFRTLSAKAMALVCAPVPRLHDQVHIHIVFTSEDPPKPVERVFCCRALQAFPNCGEVWDPSVLGPDDPPLDIHNQALPVRCRGGGCGPLFSKRSGEGGKKGDSGRRAGNGGGGGGGSWPSPSGSNNGNNSPTAASRGAQSLSNQPLELNIVHAEDVVTSSLGMLLSVWKLRPAGDKSVRSTLVNSIHAEFGGLDATVASDNSANFAAQVVVTPCFSASSSASVLSHFEV